MENNKFLFLVRHGERIDCVGKTPLFGRNDPELTQRGEKLAFQSGIEICNVLTKLGLNKDNAKIQLISSPFVRTLQTSRDILNGIISQKFKVNQIIKLDCYLSDAANFYGEYPKNFLNYFNQNKNFQKEFKDDKFELMNNIECLSIPNENSSAVLKRMEKSFELLKSIMSEEYNVYICIAHAWPLLEYGKILGYTEAHKWQDYKYYDSIYFRIDNNKNAHFIEKINLVGI